jgi:hypothetical protein
MGQQDSGMKQYVQVSASELWIGAPQWQRHCMRCARDDSMIELVASTSLLVFAGRTMNTSYMDWFLSSAL